MWSGHLLQPHRKTFKQFQVSPHVKKPILCCQCCSFVMKTILTKMASRTHSPSWYSSIHTGSGSLSCPPPVSNILSLVVVLWPPQKKGAFSPTWPMTCLNPRSGFKSPQGTASLAPILPSPPVLKSALISRLLGKRWGANTCISLIVALGWLKFQGVTLHFRVSVAELNCNRA